ncbi:UvrD-helicase domain-containing protein [Actinacidiphila glaucinigra]|uniref:UvrD-helicase domain-containing protein n=1 Tax=Actinacidiphila glaucinigra TaxID=235986 RepID=UPI002E32B1DB|nr:UvrD-helicase domain-containing protein [Actinacidiphila glaucinigra]
MLQPTDEQITGADAFATGDHLVIQAGAGTGKTTTLTQLAADTSRRGLYVAFNRAIAQDAAGRFPGTVLCKTAHALAYAAIGHRYQARLNGPRLPGRHTADALGITKPMRIGNYVVWPATLASTAQRTVTRFCQSADPVIEQHHVPPLRGLAASLHGELARRILPYARAAWADLQHPDGGAVRFEHDHYLKIWALSDPKLRTDFVLLDEAQDTNPVLEQVLLNQRGHAQLVMVGDSAQAIYGWRGAKDVMTGFDGTALSLTRSFRFGPLLALEANRWLAIADAPIRLEGTQTIPTEVGKVTQPDAVLCRSNIGAMAQIFRFLALGRRVALAGGGAALRALALAARDLQDGRRTSHPELVLFSSWAQLQDYAEHDPAGSDLQPLVDLVDFHGTDAVLAAVNRLVREQDAQVTVSTAHKAKGREWPQVEIAGDFHPPKDSDQQDEHGNSLPGPIDDADARLAYVAVTRARHRLDLGGLEWINDHPDGNP